MRTIQVDPKALAVLAYKSASEAISVEMGNPSVKRSAIESSLIAGSFIEVFTISDKTIYLSLSNAYAVSIAVVDRRVEWAIARLTGSVSSDVEHGYASVNLMWPNGKSTIWSPSILLEGRRRFPLQKLFAGQRFFNIYFNGGGVLQFTPLWNHSEQSPLLYVSELEAPRSVQGQNRR
jgi:hypothetical protein